MREWGYSERTIVETTQKKMNKKKCGNNAFGSLSRSRVIFLRPLFMATLL